MEVDKIDCVVGGVGVIGSYLLSLEASKCVESAYEPMMSAWGVALQKLKGLVVQWNWRALSDTTIFSIQDEEIPELMRRGLQILDTSKGVGIQTAFWVTMHESCLNFYRGWLGKGERPFAVDIVEGGLRGSALGLGIGFLSRTPHYSIGVQLSTGAIFGFAIGMLSAFNGSIAGAIAHRLSNKNKDNI